MVEKNELNSLEPSMIDTSRNPHLRSLWWSWELRHTAPLSAFWCLVGLPCCAHSEVWRGRETHISMAKASLRSGRYYLLEEYYETTTWFAMIAAHCSDNLGHECRNEVSTSLSHWVTIMSQASGRSHWTCSYEWELNSLSYTTVPSGCLLPLITYPDRCTSNFYYGLI